MPKFSQIFCINPFNIVSFLKFFSIFLTVLDKIRLFLKLFMMQYHFKHYYIVDIKCSTSDIIVLSQKAVFTVFEISEKLRVQKVQHVIYFACKCELNSFK